MPIDKPKPKLDIEALKKRHKELEREKAMSEANFKTATQQLDALKEEARAKYATDDLEQLKKKLQEMKDQNEQKRAEYQGHLEEIETRLAQVEKNFADPKPA
jgi:chromosome segregation ATPase